MTAWVRALDEPGLASEVHLRPELRVDGSLVLTDGYPAASVSVVGRHGAPKAYLALTAGQLRQLADYSNRIAGFLDARAKGEPGPCICAAWNLSSDPCPNEARMDYAMCSDCWPKIGGQSALDMSHKHERTATA